MTTIKEVKHGIKTIIAQFIREEVGNRLSHFSLLALDSTINAELNKLDAIIKSEEQACHNTPPEQSA